MLDTTLLSSDEAIQSYGARFDSIQVLPHTQPTESTAVQISRREVIEGIVTSIRQPGFV
jgi:hypothetical protein